MSGIQMAVLGSSLTAPFTPVTNTYNSGSGLETIPYGAKQVVIELWGGGGSGGTYVNFNPGSGGGGGAYVKKTLTFSSGNWGQTLNYAVGASNGSSTTSQNTYSTTVSLIAGAGATGFNGNGTGGGGVGGTGSGGDVNTSGNNYSGLNGGAGASPGGGAGGIGGASPTAGTAPGGGGAANSNSGGGTAGGAGRIIFAYT